MGIKETINVGLVLIRIGLVFGIAYTFEKYVDKQCWISFEIKKKGE
jgi:hypothetical protein